MSWIIEIDIQAEKDLDWFRKNNKNLYIKCFDLTRTVMKNPFKGIGKPEHLKGLGENIWSRRITLEHRMVYKIEDNRIIVASYRYHYT